MCIMIGKDIVTAVRSHTIWTVRRWILCGENQIFNRVEDYCES